MIDLCKENNAELLLIELPSADSWSKDLSDKTKEFKDYFDMEEIKMLSGKGLFTPNFESEFKRLSENDILSKYSTIYCQ